MADTYTTNLNLTKPEIGGSTNTWGNKLNNNADALDALFPSGALAVDNGGTGASDAATARTNLGLGTMATQSAGAVSITGGSALFNIFEISSTAPALRFVESDAGVDSGRWRIVAEGQTLYAQTLNDAATVSSSFITVTRSGNTPTAVNIGAPLQVSGNTVYHAGNLAAAPIAETQITDGSVLARVGSTETVTGQWNFTTVPQKTSGGKFLHYASSSQSGGAITVSTSTASGTPGEGDLWFRYIP